MMGTLVVKGLSQRFKKPPLMYLKIHIYYNVTLKSCFQGLHLAVILIMTSTMCFSRNFRPSQIGYSSEQH